ncbi:MAG TPA: GMC family oxidoreductase [Chthoniobacteraceae bacterium]|jgi:choline dehydrogenase-like flavoprotein|nr:GMC family oxidoreductase [Chthoniobacteraceae bacterium]
MKTDIVITGSGVAAAALAWKILRANPKASILVLEAGKKMKMRDFAIFQDYLVTNREPYRAYWDLPYQKKDQEGENQNIGGTEVPLYQARLTMYGGSTVHWGGWSFRLKEEDFHLQSNTGKGIDWPFDYHELEPYYCEAEHYIGVSGHSQEVVTPRSAEYPFRAFPFTLEDKLAIDALRKLNYRYSHLPIARQGVSATISSHAPCQTTGKCKYCPFGARYVAANALDDLDSLEAHPNFSVRTEIVVEEILMSAKDHATGLRCFNRRTDQDEIIEAETIIVASGAIESPKLLQRSGRPHWANGIGNDSDLVGRNLVTHPYFIFESTIEKNPEALQPEMGFPTLVSRHFDSPEEQAAGKFILVNPPDYPRYGKKNQDLMKLMQAGRTTQEIKDAVRGEASVQWQGMLEVFSEHKNRVTSAKQINHLGLRETIVDYSKDTEWFDSRLKEIQRHVETIFKEMGAEGIRPQDVSWRADHAACTTRMSHDPTAGVVDPDLKVHGVQNVYVCSNGSFSSLGAVNPTLTLTALSLRLAQHLLEARGFAGTSSVLEAAPGDLALAALA